MATGTWHDFEDQSNNISRYYWTRYENAIDLAKAESFAESDDIAAKLLEHADLPRFIRAGCHILLANSGIDAS